MMEEKIARAIVQRFYAVNWLCLNSIFVCCRLIYICGSIHSAHDCVFLAFSSPSFHVAHEHSPRGWTASRWHITPTPIKVQPRLRLSLTASRPDWIIQKKSHWGNRRDNSKWQIKTATLMKIGYMCVRAVARYEARKSSRLLAAAPVLDRSGRLSPPPSVIAVAWRELMKKHRRERNLWNRRTSLLIFQLHVACGHLLKKQQFRRSQSCSVIEGDERWFFTLWDNGLDH